MHKALHPRDDIDYMCQENKEEDSKNVLIGGLKDYIEKSEHIGLMFSTVKNSQ